MLVAHQKYRQPLDYKCRFVFFLDSLNVNENLSNIRQPIGIETQTNHKTFKFSFEPF